MCFRFSFAFRNLPNPGRMKHATRHTKQTIRNMKTVYAIAAAAILAVAHPSSVTADAADTIVVRDKATPELRPLPNDTIGGGGKSAARLPRADSDGLALQQAKPLGISGADDEEFIDAILRRALRDRSGVDESLLRRLRIDLSPCFHQAEVESKQELAQCLRTVLAQYSTPDELTKREKRRIVRRARQRYSSAAAVDRSDAL